MHFSLHYIVFSDLTEEEDKSSMNVTVSATPRQHEFKVPSVPPPNKFTNEWFVLKTALL